MENFSIRTQSLLMNAGIKSLQELSEYTAADLLKFRNFGYKSLQEVKPYLKTFDFTIKSDSLEQIERLKADKAELLEILNETFLHITPLARFLKEPYQTGLKSRAKSIESLIQKHKQ